MSIFLEVIGQAESLVRTLSGFAMGLMFGYLD
jgi:hypothetical protein